MTARPQDPPLLLVCALGIERFALRGGSREAASSTLRILRTGMGPRAAAESVGRTVVDDGAIVVAIGFCAGLEPGMQPGDVVVATEVRDTADTDGAAVPCSAAAWLTRALRARGHTAHTGPLTSCDHLVRGRERATLHAQGAIGADMESAATLRTALAVGKRRVAAVRVVVDTPKRELVRFGTFRTGIIAFRTLRATIPVFRDWHRTLAGDPPAEISHNSLSREVS